MRIIIVLPMLGHGGGQRFVTTIANYWFSLGHQVQIISLRKGVSFFKIDEGIVLKTLNYYGKNDSRFLRRIRNSINTSLHLRKEIKNVKPDFVLSILSSTNIFTLFSTLGLNMKIYINDVMSPFRFRSWIERLSRKLIYKKASGIIALTYSAAKIIEKETKCTNIKVVPRPINSLYLNRKIIEREQLIINVGRLHPDKGQEYLLHAFKILNKPDWKLVILGEGKSRASLENLINKLDLQNRVLMPGAVNNVEEWLDRASIFAFTSVSEAYGNALLESMAVGLAPVSFDCEVGPRELIRDGKNGFLTPVGDVELFAKRLIQLIDDTELRNRVSNQARTDSLNFKIEIIGNELLEFCSSKRIL